MADRSQWEYQYVSTSEALAPILKKLNEVGADGWEVVCPFRNGVLLKRPRVNVESDTKIDDRMTTKSESEWEWAGGDWMRHTVCGLHELYVDSGMHSCPVGDPTRVGPSSRGDDNGNYLDDRDRMIGEKDRDNG